MKLEGWVIYDEEGNFHANRHQSVVEAELDFLDLDGKLQWEGEPCKLSKCTITIPPSGEEVTK